MSDASLKEFCLDFEKIYIYGAGSMARFAASELERLECKYEAFIVSDGQKKDKKLLGREICYLSDINFNKEHVGFVLGLNKSNTNDVKILLKNNGYNNYFSLTFGTFKNNSIQQMSLSERCDLIEAYSKQGTNIAVLLCNDNWNSQHTYRYRAYNIQQLMNPVSKWKFVYFFINEIDELRKFLSKISVVTLLRLKWTFELDEFIFEAKKLKKCVLYDIDDLEFDFNYLPLYMDATNQAHTEDVYQRIFATIARNFLMASQSDGFIATNQFLAQKLVHKFNQPCNVIPNFLNYEQLEVSARFCKKKLKKDFIIGYFSGTNSHTKDFRTCYEEVLLLMEEFPNIKLRVVGHLDFPEEMEKYLENNRVENMTFVDFKKLQQLISEVDVNIVPLDINDFTNCKSELKFFEAAIVKTITCASPTYVFKNSIKDGVNGFLCNEGDWYEKIKKIYLGEFDLDLIRENAFLYALENYTGEKIIKTIENGYSLLFRQERKNR